MIEKRTNNTTIQIIIVVIILVYISTIFIFSNHTGIKSNNISKSIVNHVGKYLNIPGDILNMYNGNRILRKLIHFFEYFMLTIFAFLALKSFKLGTKRICAYALSLCFLFAIFDEIHQSFIPGRTPKLIDVMIDISGGLVGIVFIRLCSMLIRLSKTKKYKT